MCYSGSSRGTEPSNRMNVYLRTGYSTDLYYMVGIVKYLSHTGVNPVAAPSIELAQKTWRIPGRPLAFYSCRKPRRGWSFSQGIGNDRVDKLARENEDQECSFHLGSNQRVNLPI